MLWAALAFTLAAQSPDSQIRAVLDAQREAWNRGDLAAFMTTYDNSPDTTFVGRSVVRGYQAILDRYTRGYPRERMGKLAFSDVSVRMLGGGHALVTGRFALDRAPESGGAAQGIYTLVLHRTKAGWKIIHDHTSAAPPHAEAPQ